MPRRWRSGESRRDLVVDAAAGHLLERSNDHGEALGVGLSVVVPQEQAEGNRAGELGRSQGTAVLLVESGVEAFRHPVDDVQARQRFRVGGSRLKVPPNRLRDTLPRVEDLRAGGVVGGLHARQQSQKAHRGAAVAVARREVRAAIERLAVGG